jgi:transcriptional regulator with XRE-family HTH domain
MRTIAGNGPEPPTPRLRAELRGLRLQLGLSSSEVTAEFGWPPGTVEAIEHGRVAIDPPELDAILTRYGVQDPQQVAELQELARAARTRMWWESSRPSIPEPYLELISAEADASRITHFHPTFVPGLLQTRSYATSITAITTLKPASSDEIEARIDARMRRQREVLHRTDPVHLIAILDETVLSRRVGPNIVMREQLDHLIRLAESGTVTLVVVPVDAGPHPGLCGPFMVLEYDDSRLDDVLCFESCLGNVVIRDRPALASDYQRLVGHLFEIGLVGTAVIAMMLSFRARFP